MTRYHTYPKNITSNCKGCHCYQDFRGKEICAWGKSFKLLKKIDNPRKCPLEGKNPPKDSKLYYLTELNKFAGFERKAKQLTLDLQ